MRTLTTIGCCVVVAILGFNIVSSWNPTDVPSQNALRAANVLDWKLDGQNIPERNMYRDGLVLPKDTVYIHDTIVVNNTKYVRVAEPESTTDTLYIPMPMPTEVGGVSVSNKIQNRDRKEFTPDEEPSSKPASVTLIVNGEKVYSSETVIAPIPEITFDEP